MTSLPRYRRIVVKVGTNVLTTAEGLLNETVMTSLVEQIADLKKQNIDVILVSSGAMSAGRAIVKPAKKLSSVAARQVLAAVGQVELMHRYSLKFRKMDCICAQVLASKEDFRDRQHYLNMRDCFTALLQEKIVPVVNENDVVSVNELMFTDNDELAALIASMVNADALILLTSVDGILIQNDDGTSAVLRTAERDIDWKSHLKPEKSSCGRGGMQTKCRNAQRLAGLGITTHIAKGTEPDILGKILAGKEFGTVFPGKKKAASSVKRWVAENEGSEKGVVIVNVCARDILSSKEKSVSLLPVGVVKIDGDFVKGDVVRIKDELGKDVGLGIAQYAAGPARDAMGKKNQKALVHCDYLYLFP